MSGSEFRTRLARSTLSRKAKAVGFYLHSLMLRFGRRNCWPTQGRIARATGYSIASVKRALRELRGFPVDGKPTAEVWIKDRQQKTRASMACRRLVANLYWFAAEALGSLRMSEREFPIEEKQGVKSAEGVRLQPLREVAGWMKERARAGYRIATE